MWKRQFYALEHANAGDSASSSSSDSSSLATASDSHDADDDGAWPASSHESDASSAEKEEEVVQPPSAKRPLLRNLTNEAEDESEDGSGDESGDEVGDVNQDDELGDVNPYEEESDVEDEKKNRKLSNQWAEAVDDDEAERVLERFDGSTTVIIVGSSNQVLKCRLCPKVVCLNAESMEAHLSSKRHARAMRQLADGRLKVQLDSDGEEDEIGETHAERHARTVTTAQEEKTEPVTRKRDSGRQRQRKRMKKKALLGSITVDGKVLKALAAAKEVQRENLDSATAHRKHTEGKVEKTAKGVKRKNLESATVHRKQAEGKLEKKQLKKKLVPPPETKVKAKGNAPKQKVTAKSEKNVSSKVSIDRAQRNRLMPAAVSS